MLALQDPPASTSTNHRHRCIVRIISNILSHRCTRIPRKFARRLRTVQHITSACYMYYPNNRAQSRQNQLYFSGSFPADRLRLRPPGCGYGSNRCKNLK